MSLYMNNKGAEQISKKQKIKDFTSKEDLNSIS